jgi:hypothetical protein
MKSNLKHFADVLVVTLAYIGMIVAPLFILLNILNVCSFSNGLFDLGSIILAVILTLLSRVITNEARIAHNRGERFLF